MESRLLRVKLVFVSLVTLLSVGVVHAATPADCPASTVASNKALAERWVHDVLQESVNDIDILDGILAEDYLHNAGFNQPLVEGRDAYKAYVTGFFIGGSFTDQEVVADQVVATKDRAVASWTIDAVYQEGQGGTVAAGTPVSWSGMTMMRFECGMVAESWTEADSLSRLQQIGAVPSETP